MRPQPCFRPFDDVAHAWSACNLPPPQTAARAAGPEASERLQALEAARATALADVATLQHNTHENTKVRPSAMLKVSGSGVCAAIEARPDG